LCHLGCDGAGTGDLGRTKEAPTLAREDQEDYLEEAPLVLFITFNDTIRHLQGCVEKEKNSAGQVCITCSH
jgi:hypothetical protein